MVRAYVIGIVLCASAPQGCLHHVTLLNRKLPLCTKTALKRFDDAQKRCTAIPISVKERGFLPSMNGSSQRWLQHENSHCSSKACVGSSSSALSIFRRLISSGLALRHRAGLGLRLRFGLYSQDVGSIASSSCIPSKPPRNTRDDSLPYLFPAALRRVSACFRQIPS